MGFPGPFELLVIAAMLLIPVAVVVVVIRMTKGNDRR